MNTLHWYIDFDEVLTNSIESVLVTLNRRYNTCYKPQDVYEWNFTNIYQNMTDQEIEDIFDSEEFFENLTWKKDAKDFLQEAYDKYPNNISIVTKGNKINLIRKQKWLKEQGFDNINFIGLSLGQSKGEVDMSDGVLLDDNQENLEESNAKWKILFENYPNKSWNKDWTGLRAKSFKPII